MGMDYAHAVRHLFEKSGNKKAQHVCGVCGRSVTCAFRPACGVVHGRFVPIWTRLGRKKGPLRTQRRGPVAHFCLLLLRGLNASAR